MGISFELYHLKDLRDKFENREFAVPNIQRCYHRFNSPPLSPI